MPKTLSGVNKLKHFLALSLSVTFSLNAFSIDNPQQSNKEAYLDLSKPELLSKPSVLLMAWFLMLVVTLLPSWSVLSELVEPRAVRVAPATSLSIVVAWLSLIKKPT
jgi:hypothetical protein